ncbi:hypothetical protein BayCH28_03810 [Mycolicibacterium sp. CH28]|uniref:hypothetical protein n=1 Tax=Mycolicibacterium sp. CH28 TaxID=2512237 RepID=UPI0010820B5C|nr:hypothetical protein [Mycolicibacterium sp. CH28]TGD89733.1 hypothetical protein BayCH28_03810 [Mycolicibacterium sp. CH28]
MALLGAGIIATPAAAPQVSLPQVHLPAIELQASVLDIFTVPALRQYIANQVLGYATLAAGFATAGVAGGEAAAALPSTVVTWGKQVVTGDWLGSLTTAEDYVVGSAASVVLPILNAYITNNVRALAVQSALWTALPQAAYLAGQGVFTLFDGVTRALIVATQDVLTAIKSLNLNNVVDAVVTGTQGVAASVGTGAQNVVDGIVGAQTTLANAFKIYPTIPPSSLTLPSASASARSAAAIRSATRSVSAPAAATSDVAASSTDTTAAESAGGAKASHTSDSAKASAKSSADSGKRGVGGSKRAAHVG